MYIYPYKSVCSLYVHVHVYVYMYKYIDLYADFEVVYSCIWGGVKGTY